METLTFIQCALALAPLGLMLYVISKGWPKAPVKKSAGRKKPGF